MLAQQVDEFLLSLRNADGMAIGLDEIFKVRALLLRLGKVDDIEPAALGRLIGPIVCRSGRDQDVFRQRFAQWFAAPVAPTSPEATIAPLQVLPPAEQAHAQELNKKLEHEAKTRLRWGWVAKLAVAMLLLALIVTLGTPLLDWASSKSPSQASTTLEQPEQTSPKPLSAFSFSSLDFQRIGIATVPLWLVLAGFGWYRSRFSVLARDFATRTPNATSVALDAAWRSLFAGQEFQAGLRWLRTYRQAESEKPDISRSLQSLLRSGYLTTLHTATRPEKPGHILLVARETARDHQTALAAVLADKLRQANVEVARFDFFRRPLRLRSVRHDGGLRPGNLPLAQLSSTHHRDRLLILSDGVEFFRPLGRQPYEWVKLFEAWDERFLLTPLPPSEWGWREQRLTELGFSVIPATSRALAELGRDRKKTPITATPEAIGPFPSLLSNNHGIGLETLVPNEQDSAVLLAQLEIYLGSQGFAWLCACAVFPELHPEITLRLGVALEWGNQRLFSEPRLLALARLPWFRIGNMPRWLRLALTRRLPKQLDTAIQAELHDILITSRSGQTGPLNLDIARRDPSLTQRLLDNLIQREPNDSPLREQIFLDFMRGRRPPEGAVLGARELEAITAQQPWLLWTAISGLGLFLALMLWRWLPQTGQFSLHLSRILLTTETAHRTISYFCGLSATLGVLAEFVGMFGLAPPQTSAWFKPLCWLGGYASKPVVKRCIDLSLMLSIVSSAGLLIFTAVKGYSAWNVSLASGLSTCLIILALRRLLASYPAPLSDNPARTIDILRRPEQLTLLSNLVISLFVTIGLAGSLYDLVDHLGSRRMESFANLLLVALAQSLFLVVAPCVGTLFALKTALRLHGRQIVMLGLITWIGALVGELIATSVTRNISKQWELISDFSLLLPFALLFLSVASGRIRLTNLAWLARVTCQGMVIYFIQALFFVLLLPFLAKAIHITDFFDIIAVTGIYIILTVNAAERIKIWLKYFIRTRWLLWLTAALMSAVIISALAFSILLVFSTITHEIILIKPYAEDVYMLTIIGISIIWLPTLFCDYLSRQRENFLSTPLTKDTQSLPLIFGVLAYSCSRYELVYSAILMPFAAWLGHRYAWRGFYLLALGMLPLLLGLYIGISDLVFLETYSITGADQGFYIACLLICRLGFDNTWLHRYFTATRWNHMHTALLFLGFAVSINNYIYSLPLFSALGLALFTFFALGLSAIQKNTLIKPFVTMLIISFLLKLAGLSHAFEGALKLNFYITNINYLVLAWFLYGLGRWLRIALLCGDNRWQRWLTKYIQSKKWLAYLATLCLLPLGLSFMERWYDREAIWLSFFHEWLIALAFGTYAAYLAARNINSSPLIQPKTGDSFDVFLCYNGNDVLQAQKLAQMLSSHGLSVWWHQERLHTEMGVQNDVEKGIAKARSMVVLIGKNGFSNWQSAEVSAFVKRKQPVMTIFLPGTAKSELPLILKETFFLNLKYGLSDTRQVGLARHITERLKLTEYRAHTDTDTAKNIRWFRFKLSNNAGDNVFRPLFAKLFYIFITVYAAHIFSADYLPNILSSINLDDTHLKTVPFNPISFLITLLAYSYFGWQLGCSPLPKLSKLAKFRVRSAARAIPHMEFRLRWLLILSGFFVLLAGLFK